MAKTVARNITISINGKEVENSLSGVGKEIGKLKGQLRNETFGSEKFKELQGQLDATKSKYKEMNDELRDTSITADEARGALNNIFTGAVTGDPQLLASGFSTISKNAKGAAKSLLAFAATPVGALIAITAAVIAGAKAWANYNSSIREQVELTQDITRLQGEQADNARILAATIEETYGNPFKETLETARVLVKEFGIDYDTALRQIDDGLLRGGKSNEEYLDSLREYGTFFAQAGFSLVEFRDIVNKGFDLGIYTDKLPDAIKEFGLSVTEQTKSTRDGFINAFGEEFTDNLFKGISDGTITVKEALQQTAQESTKVSLTVQQNAQLTADAFRGAGEDAGGALKIFTAINEAYEEQNRVLTPLEQTLKDARDATEELAAAQDKALKSDNYITLANNADIAWKQIKTGFFNTVSSFTEGFTNIVQTGTKRFGQLFSVVASFPRIAIGSFDKVKEAAFDLVTTFKGAGAVIIDVLSFKDPRASIAKFTEDFTLSLRAAKDVSTGIIDEVKRAITESGEATDKFFNNKKAGAVAVIAVEEERLKNEALNKIREEQAEKDKEKAIAAAEKRKAQSEQEIERELALKAELAEALDEFDRDQALKKELERLDEIDRKEAEELDALEREYEKLEEKALNDAELLARLEEQKQIAVQEIRDKYGDVRFEKEQSEKDKALKLAEEFKQRQIDVEEKLNQARDRAARVGINILQGFVKEGSALSKGLLIFEKALAVADIIKGATKANALITSNTAIANAAAIAASPLTGGMPFVAINTALGAKETLANNLTAATSIASIAATAIPKLGFYDGGYTGSQSYGRDHQGDVAGVVHTNEWVAPAVMTSDPKYANIIGWLENERIGRTKGYFNGGPVTAPSGDAGIALPTTAPSNDDLSRAIITLNSLLSNGINAKLNIGYPEAEAIDSLQNEINQRAASSNLA